MSRKLAWGEKTKLRIWHKSLIVFIIALSILYFGGAKKQAMGLAAIYIVTIPVTYFIERRKTLALWHKRLIWALIFYPLLSLLFPLDEVAYFLIASLIFTLLIWISQSFGPWKEDEEDINIDE
ncbi:MAG: hypothetical protein P8Y77_08005 [Nitrospirota bacterium]|jgi:hypothetical protein